MNSLRFRIISVFSLVIFCLLTATNHALAVDDFDDEEYSFEAVAVAGKSFSVPTAKAAVLLEANTGRVLFRQSSDLPLPPASTTKILTCLLATDMRADMDKPRIISEQAAAVGDMSMDLRTGEKLSLHDLLQGALIHSGNDACYAIAEIVAGSEPLFVHWMNVKGAVLGAYSVKAANTNGLPNDMHRMSAEDLARLAAYALQNDFIADTVSCKFVQIGTGSSYRSYKNTNKLLWQDDNVIGVKTGTTNAAGKCLVAAYQDGAARYVSVVLNSTDRYGESYSLLKHGAGEYMLIDLACGGKTVACVVRDSGAVRLRAEADLKVLVKEDEAADLRWQWRLRGNSGRLLLMDAAGKELGGVDLIEEK